MNQAARSDAVDLARAVALIAMAGYHFVWDLAAFGFLPPGTGFTPEMRFASIAIGSSFLALVGLSLALAHASGPRWPAFLKRLGLVAAAAALVTVASLYVEPEALIGFGILHCIAAASLLSAPLLIAPPFVAVVVGLTAIAAPWFISSPLFDPPWLVWTGLMAHEPVTVDWRPLLPWGGIVWLSLGVSRALLPAVFGSPAFRWRARSWLARAGAWLGRHSLAFYLLHQPLLYGLVFLAANLLGVAESRERAEIVAQCRPACVEAGGELDVCARACACVADRAVRARLMSRLGVNLDDAKALATACSAETR